MKVISKALENKLKDINAGKLPKKQELEEVRFQKEGARGGKGGSGMRKRVDKRWEGEWKIVTDLDQMLVFPIVVTNRRPDIVIWNEERKVVYMLELTVPWESNLEDAEERKNQRYEELKDQCEEKGWQVYLSHLGVGARGYVDWKLLRLFKDEMGFTPLEVKQLREQVPEAAEKLLFSFEWPALKQML